MNVFIKPFLKKQMDLELKINSLGFVFNQVLLDQKDLAEVLFSPEPTDRIRNLVLKLLKEFDSSIKSIHCVYEDIRKGMFHEMHTHLTPSRYQVVFWFPKDEYAGREFLYGTKNDIKSFKPKLGDICFMKTNDLKYIHGVAPLKTDTLVRTLLVSVDHVTNLGEHVTISANELKSI